MALNIKDDETIRLADEVAELAGETKTRAVRTSLEERRRRLTRGFGSIVERRQRLADLLEREIWPQIPAEELGRTVTREERETILGYGPEGV
jgi:antitoxin VapB